MSSSNDKKTFAVIGDPVEHSLSAVMHNAAMKDLKLPYQYNKIHVPKDDLEKFIKHDAPKLAGFNVTLPHKEKILPLLDWVAPLAKLIGAVNTVVQHNKQLIGLNTDGAGYLESLKEEKNFSPTQKNITILGAGGGARALAIAMALLGARRITLANRDMEKAQKLAGVLKKEFRKVQFTYTGLKNTPFERALNTSDLLVNATSIGLNQTRFENFPWQHVDNGALVSDIVYTPRMTPFLKDAKETGHAIHTGEGMLVHQGALSFQLWTGKTPNVELMHQVILKALRGS